MRRALRERAMCVEQGKQNDWNRRGYELIVKSRICE